MKTDNDSILKNDYLDILFEGRNKEYGSYELRKKYPERMRNSTLSTIGIMVLLVLIQAISSHVKASNNKNLKPVMNEVKLTEPPPLDPHRPTPPPPPPPPPVKPTVKFTPPVVTKDKDVPKEESLPEQKDLRTLTISNANHDGDTAGIDPGTNKIPGTGAAETPKAEILKWVEQMPASPGDVNSYLGRNIQYPAVARENNISGHVVVNFVVSEDGSISDVQVIKGIGGGCDEEAKRVVSGMPKWKPGKQNGRAVKVFYTLTVFFKLE